MRDFGIVMSGGDCCPGLEAGWFVCMSCQKMIAGYWHVLGHLQSGAHAIRYRTVLYGTVPYGTVRHRTVQYGTVRYGTVQYGTAGRPSASQPEPIGHVFPERCLFTQI